MTTLCVLIVVVGDACAVYPYVLEGLVSSSESQLQKSKEARTEEEQVFAHWLCFLEVHVRGPNLEEFQWLSLSRWREQDLMAYKQLGYSRRSGRIQAWRTAWRRGFAEGRC